MGHELFTIVGDREFTENQLDALEAMGYSPDRNPALIAAASDMVKSHKARMSGRVQGIMHGEGTTTVYISGEDSVVVPGELSLPQAAKVLGKEIVTPNLKGS